MNTDFLLRIYTDGGSRGNPGPAAAAVVLVGHDGEVIKKEARFLGVATNNQAEYAAVTRGLEIARIYWTGRVEVVSDSELVVRQLTGRYKVKNEILHGMLLEVKRQEPAFLSVSYVHVSRENTWIRMADALVNEALDAAPSR